MQVIILKTVTVLSQHYILLSAKEIIHDKLA